MARVRMALLALVAAAAYLVAPAAAVQCPKLSAGDIVRAPRGRAPRRNIADEAAT